MYYKSHTTLFKWSAKVSDNSEQSIFEISSDLVLDFN